MKKALLAGALLAITTVTFGQDVIRCGTNSYLKDIEAYFPEEFEAIKAEAMARNAANVTTTYKTNGGVYTIPVVVHVVYSSEVQNIDDEMIFSQIERLNVDYRRTNEDADDTPAAFEAVAADAQIEFCLAQQDPDGVISTGITRTETDINSWSLFVSPTADNYADNVKFTDKGGEDGWPKADYLNIWVCNLTGGVLGYAYPPGGVSSKDGVVIGYKYFGDGSPGGVYNKGRTATHEVGHWLGLNHTWGDDDFAAEPQCGGSDGIADTPNQEDATYGAPSFPKLDDCSPSSPGIQFMNYMDYVDDAAMNMFSEDQVAEMRDVMENNRESLLTSPGCVQGGVDLNDLLKEQLIQLSIFPNPSSGEFVFEMKNFVHNQLTIEVFNMTGQLIDVIEVSNNGNQHIVFDASNLSAGDYMVKASDGEFYLTQKITLVK
jgi:Pregnancy-associated plasma protein-A/Secretion system C-terminal sorting domain